GGTRTDRAPGDQVANVLRRNGVKQLAARRHAPPADVCQKLAGDPEALADAVAFVKVRIVDQSLPAHRRARLLKIDAHHDLKRIGHTLSLDRKMPRIVERGHWIVDRAGADNDEQPV